MKTAVILSLVALAMCTGQTEAQGSLRSLRNGLPGCHNGGSVGFCRRWCGLEPNPTKGLKCPPGQLVKYSQCACKSICVKEPAYCRQKQTANRDEADEENVGGWGRDELQFDENDSDEFQFDENVNDEFQRQLLNRRSENDIDEEIGKRTRMRPKMRL